VGGRGVAFGLAIGVVTGNIAVPLTTVVGVAVAVGCRMAVAVGVGVDVRIGTNPNSRKLGYAELGALARELTRSGLP